MSGDSRKTIGTLIESQPGMAIVGDSYSPIELLLSASELAPDVVILPLDDYGNFPGVCTHLVGEHTVLTIIGITRNSMRVLTATGTELSSGPEIPRSDAALLAAVRRASKYPDHS